MPVRALLLLLLFNLSSASAQPPPLFVPPPPPPPLPMMPPLPHGGVAAPPAPMIGLPSQWYGWRLPAWAIRPQGAYPRQLPLTPPNSSARAAASSTQPLKRRRRDDVVDLEPSVVSSAPAEKSASETALSTAAAEVNRGDSDLAEPTHPVQISKIDDQAILTDRQGMTLYIYRKDPVATSLCSGQCALNWPPLYADTAVEPIGDFGVIERNDGRLQWAYQERALYRWVGDEKPGDLSGEAIADWQVARP